MEQSGTSNSRCPVCFVVPGWRERYERLHDAVEEFLLWEPGRRGHAAARRALVAVLRGGDLAAADDVLWAHRERG